MVESLSLEGEGISSLGDSFAGVGRLVYLNLARNDLSSLQVRATLTLPRSGRGHEAMVVGVSFLFSRF